ncbi:MAG TPA: STAS domain-containing protein [Ignavibacteria bacterium]|nr:STAS domain-containing protein [Ignavibacteria bacterium]HQY52843.1 STAS domain-containing protein [Ignavibacteria bacterium]HRB00284.1 STAS domain-containing protein [Ignavibacteria bacterium]
MSDIVVKYTGEGDEKSVLIEIQNEMLGLPNHRSLNDIVNEEIKNDIKNFCFDLSNLTAISSSGIGVLIGNLKNINSAGGKLKIENANDKILNIFRISKLDSIFNLNG